LSKGDRWREIRFFFPGTRRGEWNIWLWEREDNGAPGAESGKKFKKQ